MLNTLFSIIVAVWFAVQAGANSKQFVNVGTDAKGVQHGVPKATVEKRAAERGITFQQAAREIGAEIIPRR